MADTKKAPPQNQKRRDTEKKRMKTGARSEIRLFFIKLTLTPRPCTEQTLSGTSRGKKRSFPVLNDVDDPLETLKKKQSYNVKAVSRSVTVQFLNLILLVSLSGDFSVGTSFSKLTL